MQEAPQQAIGLDEIVRLNPAIWLESFGRIRDERGRSVRPKLNVLQKRINALYVSGLLKRRPVRMIGVKPRKRGFSTMVGAIHYSQLMNFGHEGVIVGDKLDTSDIVFRMMVHFADTDEFRGRWGSGYDAQTEKVKWEHGSLLRQATARGKATCRGMTPQFCHGTEVAHWENPEEAMDATMNAVPDSGFNCVVWESTPFGAGEPFALTWDGARWPTEDECPDGWQYWKQWEALCPDVESSPLSDGYFVRVFAAWYEFEIPERMRLNAEQKAHVRSTLDAEGWYFGEQALIDLYGESGPQGMRLGKEVVESDIWDQLAWRRLTIKTKCRGSVRIFDEEHPKDPKTAFLSSGRQVFEEEGLTRINIATRRAERRGGVINEHAGAVTWRDALEGEALYWLWEKPRVGCRYILSVDLAEGEDQTKGKDPDRHSALLLRDEYLDERGVRHLPRLVARVKPPNRMPMIPFARVCFNLSLMYGGCTIIPEMNNSGMAFITALRALHGTANIWQRTEVDPHSGRERRWDGWRTTDNAEYKGLRATIIWNLHEALVNGEIVIECPNVHFELASFVDKRGRMEAGGGSHDDDVLSLAIGLYSIGAGTVLTERSVRRRVPSDLAESVGANQDLSGW
jgi:hypothetical protein